MFYQLSQSTKVCRRMRCIGSNIYYTAIRGGCQDRRRENFLLSVWASGEGAWDGVCPPPHAFAVQRTRTFLYPHLRISLHERLLFSARAPSRLRARGQALRERLAASAHAHFPASAPVDRLSTNACCSAHAPSRLRACGQAFHERFAVSAPSRLPPTDRLSASALRLQRTRVILPAFIS